MNETERELDLQLGDALEEIKNMIWERNKVLNEVAISLESISPDASKHVRDMIKESGAKHLWTSLTEKDIDDLWKWSFSEAAVRTASTQLMAFVRAVEEMFKAQNTSYRRFYF